MITWMQRHKKYLIITIWISTIAFVGAGFVGWGQYSYGDKAGAVAKVGEIELTMGELQKSYSRLYSQYNQMFQGNFDEEKAKAFGLQRQALKQLTDQALILNLAASYDLEVNNTELIAALKTQEYFFKNGVFDKETYRSVLSRNKLTLKEYEADLKKQLLIEKTLKLLPVQASENESAILNMVMRIADKINYKVLDDSNIVVDTSDTLLKPFWETKKQNFMSEVSYEIEYLKQEKLNKEFDEAKISSYYTDNRTHFKDAEGKILPLKEATSGVLSELNAKATKDKALRTYIAYKKGKLSSEVSPTKASISMSNHPFNVETFEKIAKISLTSPYLKPVQIDGEFFTIKLIKTTPAKTKSFEEAKSLLLPLYVSKVKKEKLLALAQNSIATFNGQTTDFITATDAEKVTQLTLEEAKEFLEVLFNKEEKRSMIALNNGKIVLYNIMEQKLLNKTDDNENTSLVNIKSAMFNKGLIKNLSNKYATEIFIEGL